MTFRKPTTAPVLATIAALVLTAVPISAAAQPNGGTAEPPVPRVEPAPEGEWVAGDLHVHTTYSHDSYGGPGDDNTGADQAHTAGHSVEQAFRYANQRGLDYLAITDHNDVRSQADDGFGRFGVIGVGGYENSLRGHAQMLGADRIYDNGDATTADVRRLAGELRADGGVFSVNHPAEPDGFPDELDWSYGYQVVPDTVEAWNVTTAWQPPMPAANNNDDNVRYWEGWLDRGDRVAAVGGSDSHWASTAAAQGPGQPTTWVYVTDRSQAGVLEGLREGRTSISAQPPASGGARVFLEADGDADGVWESMVGGTVPAESALRVRVEDAAGAMVRIVTTGGRQLGEPVAVTGDRFTHRFTADGDATWVRAEVYREDAEEAREEHCDPLAGDRTTFCRNRIARQAMTSAIYLGRPEPATGPSFARVADGEAVLSNKIIERRWSTAPFKTTRMRDRRTGMTTGPSPELRLRTADGVEVTGADLEVDDAVARSTSDGGYALRLRLERPGGPGHVTRTYTVYPGVAGMRVETDLGLPGVYTGYTLDEVAVGTASATAHHFNAGYDWRGSDNPDWEPSVAPSGGAHTGDHRETSVAEPGEPLDVTGQWISLDTGENNAFMVLERVNYDSSHVAYDGEMGRAHVQLADDLAYLGPFEADVHVDNPSSAPIRARTVTADRPLRLESVFTGLATGADDEPWQFHRYLAEHRGRKWLRAVTFNSNGVDDNRISTGAKDDMDLAEVERQADVAARLGIETFVLDDGWQAASGDWCPDSPECPEPRGMYPDRFPDDDFTAVRGTLGDMRLGLWMSPMHFNPAADAYRDNPEWACSPVGDGLVAANIADPDSGSNEAGIGTWNPAARSGSGRLIDYIEGRIRRAIDEYGARYFKFDFLVWLDCLDADPVTAYDYRDSFVAMLDRLIASYPEVTFQIDETNDYRMFPFESVTRGPTWYANGHPTADEALHNLWVFAPYVPGYTIGQAALAGDRARLPTDFLMAVALPSHLTFFTDLTAYTDEEVATAAEWIEIYQRHRERFAGFAYPLLDDPLGGKTWTALQPWNPETRTGALLVYRQDHPADTKTVALRGIEGEGTYRITDARSGAAVGSYAADELRAGIPVRLPDRHSAAVWLVDPAA